MVNKYPYGSSLILLNSGHEPLPPNDPARTTLPLELFDDIFQHIPWDEETLRSWALTCRAFVIPARSRLFTQIHMNSQNYSRFMDVCHNAPYVPGLVKNLTYTMEGDPDGTMQYLSTTVTLTPALSEFVTLVAPLVDSIEQLTLVNFAFGTQFTTSLAIHFPQIRSLHLVNCRCTNFRDIDDLLRDHPSVTEFGCARPDFLFYGAGLNDKKGPSPQVTTLRLLEPLPSNPRESAFRFYEWFLERGNVDTLAAHLSYQTDMCILDDLASSSGAIQHLELLLDIPMGHEPPLSGNEFVGLVTIRIIITVRQVTHWALHFVSDMEMDSLQTIYLTLPKDISAEELASLQPQWKAMDESLVKAASLKKVIIKCDCLFSDTKSAIRSYLPITNNQGILVIE